MHRPGRQQGRDARAQSRAAGGAGEQGFAELDELIDEGVVAFFGLAQLFGEFAAVQQDVEDALALLVPRQVDDGLQAEVA
ncbi:hypothetical protein D3C76_1588200 [compost metagenome]